MTIEKLNGITPDLTKQNIARIAELFPECVTEGPIGTASDHGAPVIDFDLLRQALSDHGWDYVLLERLNLPADSLRALLAASLAADPAFITRHAQGTVEEWTDETHRKTRACYLFRGKPLRKGIAVSLDRTYTRPNTLVVLEQLKIASVRLAWALNRALDPAAPATPPVPRAAAVRPDSADYFRAAKPEPEDAPPAPSRPSSARPASDGSAPSIPGAAYAWSANSKVYHLSDCADVRRIKAHNLRRGSAPPPGLTLHSGCPKRD